MPKFEVVNELTLKVTFDTSEYIHTKVGAMIGYQGNMHFDKELLGPGNNIVGQALGQLARRFTGENLPLVKAIPKSPSVCYFANLAQHVTVLDLAPGERLAVESESILAFSASCKYGVMFLPTGVIGQKGLATSTITGPGSVAFLTDGNPIVLKGACYIDADAMVAFTGNQPGISLDLSWKNLIGNAGGESYSLKFTDPNNIVIVQPYERISGIDIGMDGKGGKPQMQDNNLFRQGGNQGFDAVGDAFGGNNGFGNNKGGLGGLGSILGGIINS